MVKIYIKKGTWTCALAVPGTPRRLGFPSSQRGPPGSQDGVGGSETCALLALVDAEALTVTQGLAACFWQLSGEVGRATEDSLGRVWRCC